MKCLEEGCKIPCGKSDWGGLGFLTAGALCLLALLCLMPALLLYYLGYQARMDWNNGAVQTDCVVVDGYIDIDTCSESCNCYQVCSGSGNQKSCHTNCNTCYYDCYDVYVRVSYSIDNDTNIQSEIKVKNDLRHRHDATKVLEKKYKVGSKKGCYYQEDNPTDVRFSLHNPTGYLAGFFIFVILGGLCFICFIGGLIYIYCSS